MSALSPLQRTARAIAHRGGGLFSGWGRPLRARLSHSFVNGRSLCGRFLTLEPPNLIAYSRLLPACPLCRLAEALRSRN